MEKEKSPFNEGDPVVINVEFRTGDGRVYPIGSTGVYRYKYNLRESADRYLAYVMMDNPPGLILIMTDQCSRCESSESSK